MSDNPVRQRPKSRRNLVFLFFLGALLLLLIWLGLKAYKLAQPVQSLLAKQTEIETLMSGGLTQIDPDEAEELLADVRADVLTLKRESAIFMPIAPHLGWLPKAGPILAVAPELMEMADAGTETAVHAFNGLKPALQLLQSENEAETGQMSALIHILDEAEPDLILANQSMARVVAARAAIGDISAFPGRVRVLFEQVDPLLEMGDDGLQAALVLPELMGIDEPKTYLIMAQNEDELRATGGFITGAGLLQVADGRIVSLEFTDGNQIDNWAEKPYDLPPQPYYDLMGLELFLFRDSNFWPDFPTSAETAIRLYSYGQDVPEADGVIAIDQQAIQFLLRGMGPVTIPDINQIINANNVIKQIQSSWAKPEEQSLNEWYRGRKSFLGTFGQAIQAKIDSGLGDIDLLDLVQNLHTAVSTKHVQIYMRDPEVATVFDNLNWDGRLQNPTGQDYLSIIDMNMGFNKVNMFVESNVQYNITLFEDGRGEADLTINYLNNAPISPNETTCFQDAFQEYSNSPEYLDLTDECFWNYVRVYAPENSTLTGSSTHVVPAETTMFNRGWDNSAQTLNEFSGWTTFANYLLIPQQEQTAVTFRYTIPNIVRENDGEKLYQLTISPQAGASLQNVQLNITLPPGTKASQTSVGGKIVHDNQVSFNLDIDSDMTISVIYH